MGLCVYRVKSGGVYCVTGGWFTSAVGPGYWEFDVLHEEKATYKKVKKKERSYSFPSGFVRSLLYVKL